MKRIVVLLLAVIMLLGGCGVPNDTDITEDSDVVTDAPDTELTETDTPETDVHVEILRDDFSIVVVDDTYVLNEDGNGNRRDDSFSTDTLMDVKSTGAGFTRYGYVKFDISELVGNNEFTCIDLDLTVLWRQVDATTSEYARVEIYGCDPNWQGASLTFNSQPATLDLVTSIDDLGKNPETRSFPVTAYVKKALQSGATEVAFCIKEATPDSDIRVQFATKEGGNDAARLSVYHGTKVDTNAYSGDTQITVEVSKNGLDAIIGEQTNSEWRIDAIEDTYVQAGDYVDTNYGSSEVLDFKASSGKPDNFYRITLIKFDISEIKERDFLHAELLLNCTSIENENIPTTVNVYGCFPYDWSEMSVTYNTLPEREDLIVSDTAYGIGILRIDVTDYVKRYQNSTQKYISFWLEGDIGTLRRLNFASRESGDSIPQLVLGTGAAGVNTVISYTGVNPWEYAMENVSDWLNRWEIIKQGGESDVETIVKDNDEYSLVVGATLSPNGANTRYTKYPTRTVDTLKGYTPNMTEASVYDIYGGLMDESMKQEATGFFYTKKIGDRWWTIDPLGYPFYRTAVVAIGTGSSNQSAAITAKYGNIKNWAESTTDRLRELGYNSTGGWSSTKNLIATEQPLSQTSIMYVLSEYCKKQGLNISTSGNTALVGGILPVFDPEFAETAGNIVKKSVAGYENSPYIYGWMSDNELPASMGMLDTSLSLDINDSRFIYSYATAWTFMYLKTGKVNVSEFDVTDEHRKEYRAMVYDRYFKIVSEALDRYAPNHQYLGCRFVDGCFKDEYVMRVAGNWCDVISYNYYAVWEGDAELLANQQKWSGKPIIITEWYAKGMDVWEQDNRMTNESGAGWTVKDQNDRGLFYQNFALQLLECKGCVGFDWFQYIDNDPENKSADLSNINSNKGIVNNEGEEYTVLTKYMEELNNQKYNLISYFDER